MRLHFILSSAPSSSNLSRIIVNCIIWNCQAAASKGFLRALKDKIKRNIIDMLGLLETKVSREHVDEICKRTDFKNCVRVESVGYSGGIWVF